MWFVKKHQKVHLLPNDKFCLGKLATKPGTRDDLLYLCLHRMQDQKTTRNVLFRFEIGLWNKFRKLQFSRLRVWRQTQIDLFLLDTFRDARWFDFFTKLKTFGGKIPTYLIFYRKLKPLLAILELHLTFWIRFYML